MSIFSTRILLATDGSGEAELAASNGEGGPRPHRSAKSRVTHRQQQRAWADSRSWEAGAGEDAHGQRLELGSLPGLGRPRGTREMI
ncbi:MAG: hypothetical protein K0S10_1316 [Rubrobacteraceae bacterium]|nr:hypothetical protein [Rubrobacteraceae bacterium]